MKPEKKHDLVLIVALAAVAAALLLLLPRLRPAGETVEVRVRGELVGIYPLAEDAVLDIDGACTLTIADGKAEMTSATCKNQICVHHPAIFRGGEMIVCLPNGVTVKVRSSDEPDFLSGGAG